jgi:hypothetical protein
MNRTCNGPRKNKANLGRVGRGPSEQTKPIRTRRAPAGRSRICGHGQDARATHGRDAHATNALRHYERGRSCDIASMPRFGKQSQFLDSGFWIADCGLGPGLPRDASFGLSPQRPYRAKQSQFPALPGATGPCTNKANSRRCRVALPWPPAPPASALVGLISRGRKGILGRGRGDACVARTWISGVPDEPGKGVPHACIVENRFCRDDDDRFSVLRKPRGGGCRGDACIGLPNGIHRVWGPVARTSAGTRASFFGLHRG